MNIFIWAPFIQKVGTTTNVENLINCLLKFSKKNTFKIDLVNVFGEWDDYKFEDSRVNKIPLLEKKPKKWFFKKQTLHNFDYNLFHNTSN